MSRGSLTVGTRGSSLARLQTDEVLRLLRQCRPDVDCTVQAIRTQGDRDRTAPLTRIGGTGVFAKELELALINGSIDLAVHSLKDLPPTLLPGLVLAAVPVRADPRDALISYSGGSLASLPSGARIGTGSARRRAILRRIRPDLQIVDIRGNVETRIQRARRHEVDAVVLAAAGLGRLGLAGQISELFPTSVMLPAPGQGAIAVEVRRDDTFSLSVAQCIDDMAVRACATAERSFLAHLGAGCSLPVAAYASLRDATIELAGLIVSADGETVCERTVRGPIQSSEALGHSLAARLLASSRGLA